MTRARDVADLQSGAVEFSSTISLTDSDVAHGMTGILPTATYGQLAPESGTEGGVRITTATEGATAYSVTATSTTPSTDGNGAVFRFRASKKSGTSEQALADTDDLMTIGNVGVEKVFIQGSGNIGINASPISYANAQATLFLQDDSNPAIGISDTGQSKDYFIVANGSRLGIVYGDGSNSGSFSNSTEIASFNNNGRVGLGTDNPSTNFVVSNGTEEHQVAFASGEVYLMARNQSAYITQEYIANVHVFTGYGDSSSNEAMRIESDGDFVIGETSSTNVINGTGAYVATNGQLYASTSSTSGHFLNVQNDSQAVLNFRHAGSTEGDVSISGSTVTYNGFSGTHESSGIASNVEIGTVCSTIDELDVYPDTQPTAKGGTQEHPKKGQTRADHAKIKVSDTEGDKRVYGVLQRYDNNGKPLVASVGIGSVRVTGACEGGDLLESNGDGTAKVQSDDIIRSKTIGKVTIGNSNTGVKLVSCVLYCG